MKIPLSECRRLRGQRQLHQLPHTRLKLIRELRIKFGLNLLLIFPAASVAIVVVADFLVAPVHPLEHRSQPLHLLQEARRVTGSGLHVSSEGESDMIRVCENGDSFEGVGSFAKGEDLLDDEIHFDDGDVNTRREISADGVA